MAKYLKISTISVRFQYDFRYIGLYRGKPVLPAPSHGPSVLRDRLVLCLRVEFHFHTGKKLLVYFRLSKFSTTTS